MPSAGHCDSLLSKILGSNDIAVKVAELPERYRDVMPAALSFSPEGRRLAANSDGEKINIWEWRNKRVETTIEMPRGTFTGLSTNSTQFSPDGRLLAVCSSWDAGYSFWNPLSGAIVKNIDDPGGVDCAAMGFTPDGAQFLRFVDRARKDPRDSLTVYSAVTWRPVWGLRLNSFSAISLAISPDGALAALGGYAIVVPWNISDPVKRIQQSSRQDQIHIVDLRDHKLLKTIDADATGPMGWSPDGTRITIAGDQHVQIFDVRTGQSVVDDVLVESAHMDVRYTPDGRYLIVSDMNGRGNGLGIKIWDSRHQKLLQEIRGNFGAIDVSRDGKYLAAAIDGRTIIYQLLR